MIKHLQLKIHGRVQGVGFRFLSYDKFVELGITGTAKNEKDGTVLVDVQGEEMAVEKFIEWAHRGPSDARVLKVDVQEVPTNMEDKKPE